MDFGLSMNNALSDLSDAVNTIDVSSLGDFTLEVVGFAGAFLGLWAVWLGIRALLRAARSLR